MLRATNREYTMAVATPLYSNILFVLFIAQYPFIAD